MDRWVVVVVVVLNCAFGKGTIILDVFGSREIERKRKRKGRMKFLKIKISPVLQLGIKNFLKKNSDIDFL